MPRLNIVFEIFRDLRGVNAVVTHIDDGYNVSDSEDIQQVSESPVSISLIIMQNLPISISLM